METRTIPRNVTITTVDTSGLPTIQRQLFIQQGSNLTSPPFYSNFGQVFYMKEVTGISNLSQFQVNTFSNQIFFPSTASLTVPSLHCLSIQESPVNTFNILNMYRGTSVFSTMEMPPPTSVSVAPSGGNSSLFVDLTYQSKTIVLPSIQSFESGINSYLISGKDPYFLIKDIYGKANENPLFISTSAGDIIDGIGPSIAIRDPFASLEIVGQYYAAGSIAKRWHILNYYSGNFPDATPGPLIPAQYTISSSIANVNVSTMVDVPGTSKVLYLPPASTVKGASYMIRDIVVTCSEISSIFISTTGLDTIEINKNLAQLSTSLQSFRVIAHNSTNYAVLQNYTFGFDY